MLRAQQGDLPEVELPLQGLIRDGHPDSVLLIEALARGYMAIFRYPAALAALDDLLKHDPEHPLAYFLRGIVCEKLDNPAEALASYRQAVKLAPEQTEFRLRLAMMLLQTGQPAKAGPLFMELLGEMPEDSRVLLGAARFEREIAQPRRALEHLDRLLRDHPENAEAWAERGRCCGDQGDTAEALRGLRKAFELEPRNYQIGFALFMELNRQGLTQEAKAVEKRVESLKQDELRLERLMTRIEREGNHAEPRYEIAMIYLRNGVEGEALRWFRAALQDDPHHRPTHEALAEYYQKHGNPGAAEFHRTRAGKPGR